MTTTIETTPTVATTAPSGYTQFLESKRVKAPASGFEIAWSDLNTQLFPFQREIVRWALRRGRAAIFADCGLGKTPMQLEWARHVSQRVTNAASFPASVLILAPLAVSQQTVREGAKFGVPVTHCRTGADVRAGINITNYERLAHFDPADFHGIVLDESSILKAFDGSTRKEITDFARSIPYRLACTATPAPNDLIELTNHAEFLEIMSGKEIIALFFTQDGNTTHKWRLKGHAREEFWRWLATWSVALRRPSDLGYPDDGFALPPLTIHQQTVASPDAVHTLFPVEALTLEERRAARRESMPARVSACAELVNSWVDPWIVWCDLNAESEALTRAIPGAVQVRGSDTPEYKERAMLDFAEGRVRVLVTKPSICGFGMNWQHCNKVAFVGLSDSYEQFYQAVRRCWRFGQSLPVDCHIITAETEGAVVKNIERKEKQSAEMMDSIVSHMAGLSLGQAERDEMTYEEDEYQGEGFRMLLGDSIKRIDVVPTESQGLALFSPPFPAMYAYTNSAHDIGNTNSIDEFMEHFRYLVGKEKLMRVLMPGRLCCVHLMQLTAMKSRDGYIGIKDYRGRVISMMEGEGWIYAGEVTIDKNPQVQATRNKERGLLFKTLASDSSLMRMALADYLLYFRKPGDNPRPIHAGISAKYNPNGGWLTEEEWIEWAAPVWYRATKDRPGGIRETDVLNVAQARETDDERHLCPLQFGVIERAVKLWSAPGESVIDPFAGVGSVGVRSLQLGRQFTGIELKRSYYEHAIRHLERAAHEQEQPNFLTLVSSEQEPAAPTEAA